MTHVQHNGEAVEAMKTSTLEPSTTSGAQTSTIVIDFKKVVLNGAFGSPLMETPIDFDRGLAAYPAATKRVEEPDWNVGSTPLGI